MLRFKNFIKEAHSYGGYKPGSHKSPKKPPSKETKTVVKTQTQQQS